MPPETAARPAASSSPAPAAAADSTAPSRLFDFWPRFLLFPALAVLLYPSFVLGWGGDSFPVRAAWVALLTFCWFCVSGAYHEAAHQTLFRRPFWNLWFGRGLGVLVLVPYTAFRETHRWHHAYLNTPDDYELWPYCDPRCSLAFRRMFVWLEILGGVLVAPYIYCRIYFVGEPRLKPDARRTIFREMVATGVIWGLVLTGLVAWANARGFDWRQFDPVWLLPLLLSPMLNALRKLIEHLGMTSRDPFLGTRTIVSGNWLSRIACSSTRPISTRVARKGSSSRSIRRRSAIFPTSRRR